VLVAFHVYLFTVQSSCVVQKSFGLLCCCNEIRIFSNDAAKITNFLEEALFDAEITLAETPTSNKFKKFDFKVVLHVNIIDDKKNLS
jgi:hypothetical protein